MANCVTKSVTGKVLSVEVIDSETVDLTLTGTSTIRADVNLDPSPCNRTVASGNGVYTEQVYHFMFDINGDVQLLGPVFAAGAGTLPAGTDQVLLDGVFQIVNPSQCRQMDVFIHADAHVVLNNYIDGVTGTPADETLVQLEVDTGGGFEWISQHIARRENIGVTPLGENYQPYHRAKVVNIPPSGNIIVTHRHRIQVIAGQSARIELWPPSLEVIAIST